MSYNKILNDIAFSDCAPKLPSKQCQDEEVADKFWTLTVESLNYDPFTEDKLIKILHR